MPRASDLFMSRAFALVLLAAACGPRPGSPAAAPTSPGPVLAPAGGGEAPGDDQRVIELEPLRIDVVTDGAGKQTAEMYDARTLFEEGNDALMQRRHDEALAAYDHLLQDFPDSRLVLSTLYNAGLALEAKADYPGAAERYKQLVARGDADKDEQTVRDAQFRLGSVLAEIERFAEAVAVFEAVLARPKLSASDRIEALARLGYALIEMKDYAGAEEVLRSALAYYREIQGTEHLESDYYIGMCQYYLADIPHRQFDAIPLRLPEAQLDKDVDQKSELFLLARDRYVKTVDYKNPYWATAAVYQVGIMYKEFWDAFMAVPVPDNLKKNPEAAKMYVEEINKNDQLRKLLEKSILYHERNVAMAKNGHVQTVWADASASAGDGVKAILARQQKGELFQPGQAGGKASALEPGKATGTAPPTEYLPARIDL